MEKKIKEFWTVTEVLETFEVDEGFLYALEEEEVLCSVIREDRHTRVFPAIELEKLRLAKILHEEMGVNLAGVDIILRMRQNMIDMRGQFDDILEDLARSLKQTLR